jgi:hypothetical protein
MTDLFDRENSRRADPVYYDDSHSTVAERNQNIVDRGASLSGWILLTLGIIQIAIPDYVGDFTGFSSLISSVFFGILWVASGGLFLVGSKRHILYLIQSGLVLLGIATALAMGTLLIRGSNASAIVLQMTFGLTVIIIDICNGQLVQAKEAWTKDHENRH